MNLPPLPPLPEPRLWYDPETGRASAMVPLRPTYESLFDDFDIRTYAEQYGRLCAEAERAECAMSPRARLRKRKESSVTIDPSWATAPPAFPPEDTVKKLKRQVDHIGYLNYERAQAEWHNSILNRPDVALAEAQGTFEKLLDMALTEAYADGRKDESEEFAKTAAELDRLQARVAELEVPEMNELTDEQIEAALNGAGINIGLDDGTPGYRFIMMAAFNAVVAAARKAKP